MGTSRSFLKKLSTFIFTFLLGIIFSYLMLRVYGKIQVANDAMVVAQKFWKYALYTSGSTSLTVGNLVLALGLIILGFKGAKLVSHKIIGALLYRSKLNKGAVAAIENLSYYAMILLFTLFAFDTASIPLTMFTIFGGALAIGFGFGSQNILSNFISGIIIQVERPIKVGDFVEIEGNMGEIEHIGGRSTKVLASDNKHIVIPNSYFLDKKFVNWTLENNVIRCKLQVNYEYGTDVDTVVSMIKGILDSREDINQAPVPRVYLSELGSNSLEFSVYFWINMNTNLDRLGTESAVRSEILKKSKELKLVIPLQQQIITIKPT